MIVGAASANIALSINLTQYNIERSYDSDDVGDQVTNAQFSERLQIYEARWTDAHAPGLLRAVGNQIAANLAFWSFDRVIVITDGRLDELGHFRIHWSVGKLVNRLLNNATGLAHLFHPHQVSIVCVAVFAQRHFKIHVGICSVRPGLANVPS